MSSPGRERGLAIICPSADRLDCGIGSYSRSLARELSCAGGDVMVVMERSQGAFSADSDLEAVGRLEVPQLPSLQSLRRIAKSVRASHCDAVLLQYQHLLYGARPWVYFFRDLLGPGEHHMGLIITVHDLLEPHFFRGARFLRRFLMGHLVRGADAIFLSTDQMKAELLQRFGDLERAEVVPVGPSIRLGSSAGASPAFAEEVSRMAGERAIVLCFGLVAEDRGQLFLVDAARQLKREGHEGVLVWIVGADAQFEAVGKGEYRRRIQRAIVESDLEGNVRIDDYRPEAEISLLLERSALVAIPRRGGFSGSSTVVMSALEHGRKVLTFGARDLIDPALPADRVILSDPDPQAFAAAILESLAQTRRSGTVVPDHCDSAATGWKRVVDAYLGVLELPAVRGGSSGRLPGQDHV